MAENFSIRPRNKRGPELINGLYSSQSARQVREEKRQTQEEENQQKAIEVLNQLAQSDQVRPKLEARIYRHGSALIYSPELTKTPETGEIEVIWIGTRDQLTTQQLVLKDGYKHARLMIDQQPYPRVFDKTSNTEALALSSQAQEALAQLKK